MDLVNKELDAAKKRLLRSLEQGEKINNLTAAPEWEFFEGWINSLIKLITDDITSDKYINDHNGYLKAIAQIQAYKSIKKGIDGFKKAFIGAANKLEELEYGDER